MNEKKGFLSQSFTGETIADEMSEKGIAQDKREKIKNLLALKNHSLGKAAGVIERLTGENQDLKNESDGLRRKAELLAGRNESLKAGNLKLIETAKNLSEQIRVLQHEKEDSERKNAALSAQLQEAKNRWDEARQKMQRRIEHLEDELARAKNKTGLQDVIEQFFRKSETEKRESDPLKLYSTLGLNPVIVRALPEKTASEMVKAAYRVLVKASHPDKIEKDSKEALEEAEEKMKQLNLAQSVLSDPDKRKHYDVYGKLKS